MRSALALYTDQNAPLRNGHQTIALAFIQFALDTSAALLSQCAPAAATDAEESGGARQQYSKCTE